MQQPTLRVYICSCQCCESNLAILSFVIDCECLYLIEVLREKISQRTNISIVESDASAMKCKYAFKILGYEKLSQDYNVNLVNLSEDATKKVETCAGDYKLKLQIPQTIQNADLKINIPKIKYSDPNVKITCALKNIFGCNPYAIIVLAI